MKRIILSLIILGMTAFLAGVASAAPTNITEIKNISDSRGSISADIRSDDSYAGNVSELLLNVSSITTGWQGYYGNVSGTIVLDDANSNSMYTWSLTPSGEVYATRNVSINWAGGNINCTNSSYAATENNNIFGTTNGGDADNLTETFSESTHPSITTNGNTIAANDCPYSISTYVNDDVDAARTFNETLLWSVSDNGIIYTAILNNDGTGFTGASYDFQMLVGENGHASEAASGTTYYFFIELG